MAAFSLPHASETDAPPDLTSFVGRRRETAEIKRLLSVHRLVTLTGPGGVGKTRLAVRTAASLHRAFPDGVAFAGLGDVRDSALLAPVIAGRLGLEGGTAGFDELVDALAPQHRLLVLDNCEHIVEDVALLVDEMLRCCPSLRVLATSRQPLALHGESLLCVPTLPVPEANGPVTPQAVAQTDAARMFADRACLVVPGFSIDEENCAAVARLCWQLEGLPLAIELAAMRLGALSLEQIEERLCDRYGLLTTGERDRPARQQTLRALIDWSFEGCSPAEQRLWARLTIFPGTFELDAVEGICASGYPAAGDIVDLVASLVDKSILIREESGGPGGYRMLQTLRGYARELLTGAEQESLGRRYVDWYVAFMDRLEAGCVGPDSERWLRRLAAEHINLWEAVERASTWSDGAAAVRRLVTGTALCLDALAVGLAEDPVEPAGQQAVTSGEPPARLTRREWEIAQLIAEGLSNREIAERLVIARRTAEGHVEHILAKLGFSSRTQVAAWAAVKRLCSTTQLAAKVNRVAGAAVAKPGTVPQHSRSQFGTRPEAGFGIRVQTR